MWDLSRPLPPRSILEKMRGFPPSPLSHWFCDAAALGRDTKIDVLRTGSSTECPKTKFRIRGLPRINVDAVAAMAGIGGVTRHVVSAFPWGGLAHISFPPTANAMGISRCFVGTAAALPTGLRKANVSACAPDLSLSPLVPPTCAPCSAPIVVKTAAGSYRVT